MHNLSTQSITSCGVVRVEAHTTPYYSSSPYFSLKVVGVLVVVVVPYVVVVVVFGGAPGLLGWPHSLSFGLRASVSS